jgi:putative ATPase
LATSTPLPGVPLQIRNAPTKLMKKLGYGKHYSYNPDFAHPVYNVCPHSNPLREADGQEYLPAELAANSSLSDTPDLHFLKTPEAEAREKKWDDERLREWEEEVNGAERWEGRSQR